MGQANLFTILLFFIYMWGLGFGLTFFIKNRNNFLERNLMALGIGLAAIPVLGTILNVFNLPLDWKFFLYFSLVIPFYFGVKIFRDKSITIKKNNFKITKSKLTILFVLLLFVFTLHMYTKGSFSYTWMEDSDPWGYTLVTKQVAVTKDIDTAVRYTHYTMPYPPGYTILFGMLHQTSPYLHWTMKFFNAVIVSLSIIFFYFFARRFTNNRNKALFSTFALAMIPCWIGHFIFALNFNMVLILVAFYALEMIKKDKKWIYPAGVVIAGLFVSHVYTAIIFMILIALYLGTKIIVTAKLPLNDIYAFLFGAALSLFFWVPAALKYDLASGSIGGLEYAAELFSSSPVLFFLSIVVIAVLLFSVIFFRKRVEGLLAKVLPEKKPNKPIIYSALISALVLLFVVPASYLLYLPGSASRNYYLKEFFIATKANMINNPIGIGLVISLLAIFGVIFVLLKFRTLFSEDKQWMLIAFIWLVYCLLAVNGERLSIAMTSFRLWTFLAIPVVLLAAQGFFFIANVLKRFKFPILLFLVIIVLGVIFTSGVQRYYHNTAVWPPSYFTTQEELVGYDWFYSLPLNTPVFDFTNYRRPTGYNMYTCEWCPEVADFRDKKANVTLDELYSVLKNNGYEYLIFSSSSEAHQMGIQKIAALIQETDQSPNFQVAHSSAGESGGMYVFKVL